MKVEVKPQNRPQYFEKNGVCVRIDNIVFVQKSSDRYYQSNNNENKVYNIDIGISGIQGQFCINMPCYSEEERENVYTQLTTLLMLL